MKLVALAVFGLGTTALLAAPARAECGIPSWLGTPTGATIPSHGSLYQYDEGLAHRTPKVGGPIVSATPIDDRVVRLDYTTTADELEIKLDDFDAPVFTVARHWEAPAAAPRVIQYWHHVHAWMCSHADSLMLQIDQPTAAFRVFWQFRDHPVQSFVVPARTDANNVNVLELGKIDCGSTLIDPDELAAGGILTLVAIRYDGSEVAVAGLPPTLSTVDMPTSEDGLSRAIGYQTGTEPVAPVPPPDHDWPFHLFLMLLVPAGLLTVVVYRHRALKAVS